MLVRTPLRTVVNLTCPAQTDMLSLIRAIVVVVSKQMGFPPDEVSLIEMAVDEACTNVIRHAYVDDGVSRRRKPVLRVQIRPARDRLTIHVIDRGKGFTSESWHGVSSIEKYVAQPKPEGLGSYVIGRFMDEVAYGSRRGSGTVLRMVKYLNRPPATDELSTLERR